MCLIKKDFNFFFFSSFIVCIEMLRLNNKEKMGKNLV